LFRLMDFLKALQIVGVGFAPIRHPPNHRPNQRAQRQQERSIAKRVGPQAQTQEHETNKPGEESAFHATGNTGSSGCSAGTADLSFSTLASNAAKGRPVSEWSFPTSIRANASHSAREKETDPRMCSSNASYAMGATALAHWARA